jgi:dipeptidyl aminopeptidase/acylaminoacyl peptidase
MRAALTAALFLAAAPAALAAAPVATRQVGSATLQNVPEIPEQVRQAVQRYQNYRDATFEDWLPDGSMLIGTRFGATRQLHRVAAPGGARTQLTFFSEPVSGAWTIPGGDRFLLSRDTGGDEWFQLFAMGMTGDPVPLTEPGTRNQAPVFSKDGRLAVWSRAVKGSADYAILVADPTDPASRRVAYQGRGSIAPTAVSPDGKRVLLSRTVSNREMRLAVLDLASGQAGEIPYTGEPARYLEPRFTPDGRGIIAITDHGSDLLRLVRVDLASGARTVLSPESRWDVVDYDVSDDGRLLAYSTNEEGFSTLRLLDLASRRALRQPPLPRGVITGLGFSPDGRKLAFSLSSATSAGDVWSWDTRKAELTRWTHSELGGLDPARLAEPELIRFSSFDGLSVPAFVYRPKGRGARCPNAGDHRHPRRTRVAEPPRLEPGGAIFCRPARRHGDPAQHPRQRGLRQTLSQPRQCREARGQRQDIGALLDWIGTQPGLDPARVAVYGQSYGGYMSLAAMTHYSDRLVGGVERYGISNWISFLNNTEAYRRDNRRAEYGDERVPAMRAVLERISPLPTYARSASRCSSCRAPTIRASRNRNPIRWSKACAAAASRPGTSCSPTRDTASSRSPTTTCAARSKPSSCAAVRALG